MRKILFPFALLYDGLTRLRNFLYDQTILSSEAFDLPVICVGNLSVGGTGKTPMVEFLIRLLKEEYQVAVLSRGYGRKTKGFLLANQESTAASIGDEPFQYYKKFSGIKVAVDEQRLRGCKNLLQRYPKLDVILLDDAFQHRAIKPSLSVLLTTFAQPYSRDYLLPMGDLREARRGAGRAELIVLTKSPNNMDSAQTEAWTKALGVKTDQSLYFSSIRYAETVQGFETTLSIEELKDYDILLLTGIARPQSLIDFLKTKEFRFEHLTFPDHKVFGTTEQKKINKAFADLKGPKKLILTTEKDYVRNNYERDARVFYLPIETNLLWEEDQFKHKIIDHVRKM